MVTRVNGFFSRYARNGRIEAQEGGSGISWNVEHDNGYLWSVCLAIDSTVVLGWE
jgi:hypothetical protein